MKLLFRADASTEIGTGHVMRCMALAQACLQVGSEAIFLMAMPAPALEARLKLEGIKTINLSVDSGSIEDAKETVNITQRIGASWVIVDGYHFGSKYQKIIKDSGLRLLFIDDYGHADQYFADIILNQNIYAHQALYPNHELNNSFLLGVSYALLRQEFWQWRGWQRETSAIARKVLVTMGGSDPDNITLKIMQALGKLEVDNLEVIAVVGGSNPHYEQLQSIIKNSPFPLRLERNVSNMPELMAWADIAVSGGGSTTWEMAFMGLPCLVLILADNQKLIAEKLDAMKVAVNLGWYGDVSNAEILAAIKEILPANSTRMEMSRLGQKLIDGYGAARVAAILVEAKV